MTVFSCVWRNEDGFSCFCPTNQYWLVAVWDRASHKKAWTDRIEMWGPNLVSVEWDSSHESHFKHLPSVPLMVSKSYPNEKSYNGVWKRSAVLLAERACGALSLRKLMQQDTFKRTVEGTEDTGKTDFFSVNFWACHFEETVVCFPLCPYLTFIFL